MSTWLELLLADLTGAFTCPVDHRSKYLEAFATSSSLSPEEMAQQLHHQIQNCFQKSFVVVSSGGEIQTSLNLVRFTPMAESI